VDFTILRAINVSRLEGLHERHGLSEPCLEIGKALLRVVMFWDFNTREPRSGSFGEVRCNLDLTAERKHVGGEAVIREGLRINLAAPSMGFSLVHDCGDVV